MFLTTLLTLVLSAASTVHAAVDADEITDLPGLTHKLPFKQYSGYLKATGTRKLHYWFVESAGNPQEDPVVLWLNGGPGCSSLDGLLSEHGPFRVADDGATLVDNPYSWNKVANMLYLEAPAGVGYSYSDDKNYTTSDDEVSLDNYYALKYFLLKFSEFQRNEFFITGESYGGVYVPTLSVRVAEDKMFNFKGYAVGNGISDWNLNAQSIIYFWYYHGLFGEELWELLVDSCCRNGNSSDCNFYQPADPACQNAVNRASEITSELNVYNLYEDCYKGPDDKNHSYTITTAALMLPQIFREQHQLLKATPPHKLMVVPPCVDVRASTEYLNKPAVRKALHIPEDLPKWEICSGVVGALYQRQYTTLKSQYEDILSTKRQRIMVYNGDIDMACNFLHDEWFVDSLKQKVLQRRKSWHFTDKSGTQQVAGYVKQFENLTFVTVKGAGHMVPQDKPIPSLEMFTKFLKGTPF